MVEARYSYKGLGEIPEWIRLLGRHRCVDGRKILKSIFEL
jgi:hypothetical protein